MLNTKNKVTPRPLFLKYNKGKCFNQLVGVNSSAKIPGEIDNYLKLSAGHCFRCSSPTLLINGRDNYITETSWTVLN